MATVTSPDTFGKIGIYLSDLLQRYGTNNLPRGGTFVSRLITLQNSFSALRHAHPLLPAAANLLLLDFPLQTDIGLHDFIALVREAHSLPPMFDSLCISLFPPQPGELVDVTHGRLVRRLVRSSELRDRLFPPKRLIAGETKTNVTLGGCLRSAQRLLGSHKTALIARACIGLPADHLCGVLIFLFCAWRKLGEGALGVALFLSSHPTEGKYASMVLKALGLNSTDWGALFCETQCLAGRATGTVDVKAEARRRCDPSKLTGELIDVDPDTLRDHVRSILRVELPNGCTVPTLDDFWTSRWLWCVNGSHTGASSDLLGIPRDFLSATHERVYRRAASETVKLEPLTSWDGYTSVSASQKLEHGKTRAIFACDTRSYFAFSWVLGSVQKAWRNSRVILDPGTGGHLGMAQRIINAQRGGGVNLMLDYDDFNSHHSNGVMAMVFDELCKHVGMPDWYRDVLVKSFDRIYYTDNNGRHKIAGTLMSGHRATTFINSVLNAAYIRAAIGSGRFDSLLSLHTGDDVYIRCNTLADCAQILEATTAYGCRMNPAKQSIGFRSAEFLRMGIRGDKAYGYLSRSISSLVSGNWSSNDPLAPLESLQTLITGCRAVINRSGVIDVAAFLAPALRYPPQQISNRTLIELLRGEVALEGSPVFNTQGRIQNYAAYVPRADELPIPSSWKRHATTDYLSYHVSPIEAAALEWSGADAPSLLIASSYSKGLNKVGAAPLPPVSFKRLPVKHARGYVCATDLSKRDVNPGVLTKYPVINLVKSRLTTEAILDLLVVELGYRPSGDPREIAFGGEAESKCIFGTLSYPDAAAFSKLTTAGNIYTLFSIAM
ncbi:RNA directed RNA polymerase [Beauveria bassiana victorivirus 1]|uniref:RNA-directed RNA polymerase n=1 Tax=Beauveria bassiana victorivirus 1 TaxID=1685109 RepID=G3C8V4_9VIRU|nr:RNA directed RNA polymerase [Beauveria bassiana victorivirus 1]CCC42235.1 RNA directed RNA polymerase [Beauveria bassiana victorivirus 1]